MFAPKKSSRQWFDDARRCYQEFHQGCPWCGGSHRVYHLQRGTKQVFTCQTCDFQAVHDEANGQYRHIEGEPVTESPDTMCSV